MSLHHFRIPHQSGFGCVAIGNAFRPTSNEEAEKALEGAWNAGVRYYDTSPWYGLGLSERRLGHFLIDKHRDEYILSTKVGRLLKATDNIPETMWHKPSPFTYEYDYTASGVRRSIEDSLQRLGIERLDVVYIHDLSPDNGDFGKNWEDQFEIAKKGAMPELTRMREEGLIQGWGLGVNTIEPILATLEVADADIFLCATQYSLMYHDHALNNLFPACEKRNVSIVVGAPLNAGFLAGIDRYDYGGDIPNGMTEKRERIKKVCHNHNVDLRTAALQFCIAPNVVSTAIPGTRSSQQAIDNYKSLEVIIPDGFWEELKKEKLINEHAPLPAY